MASKEDLQIDIIKELSDYSTKIIPGVKMLVNELREGKKDDTDELFNLVIQGINWEIEVFNNCEDVINADKKFVDKSKMAQAVSRLGGILKEKDDIKLAACLEVDFLPFLNSMSDASSEILQKH